MRRHKRPQAEDTPSGRQLKHRRPPQPRQPPQPPQARGHCTRYVAVHPLRGGAPEQKRCIAYGSGAVPQQTRTNAELAHRTTHRLTPPCATGPYWRHAAHAAHAAHVGTCTPAHCDTCTPAHCDTRTPAHCDTRTPTHCATRTPAHSDTSHTLTCEEPVNGRGRVSDPGRYVCEGSGRAYPLARQGLGGEILRAVSEDTGDTPRGQFTRLVHVVDGPHVDLEARVAHRAHIGGCQPLHAGVDRGRA